jgi:hypothetical protein
MIKKYNNISLAWGGPGILVQIFGKAMNDPIFVVLGTVLLMIGLAYYAKAKGRSSAWCLLGFLSIFGLIILGLLKDLHKEGQSRNSIKVKCPHCAELIQKDAVLCKHCKSTITSIGSVESQKKKHILNKYGITSEEYDIFVVFKELKAKRKDLSEKGIIYKMEEDFEYTEANIEAALNKIKKVTENSRKAKENQGSAKMAV